VVDLKVFTVGGVVAPGQKLMEIVPDRRPLVIEARVKPADASDLHVGRKSEIRIPAFHDRGMPSLHGVVSNVSADALDDERSGAPYFHIEVTIPPQEVDLIRARRGGEDGLHAGLPVDLMIPSRRRTALEYLLQPLQQMLWGSFHER
jgi:HlyD family secretion protein